MNEMTVNIVTTMITNFGAEELRGFVRLVAENARDHLGVVADNLNYCLGLGAEELRNWFGEKANRRCLAAHIKLLNELRGDVQSKLQKAEHQPGKKRRREVDDWLKNMDNTIRKFEKLLQDAGRVNILARRRFRRQVVMGMEQVGALVDQGTFRDGVVLDLGIPLVTSEVPKGHAFEDNLNTITKWVMVDDVISIGISGIRGSGKTMLAMHLHDNLLRQENFYHRVYWVHVTPESNNIKLQNAIAKSMKIDLSSEDDEIKRRSILSQAWIERKGSILIMDNVSNENQFDRDKIGLPLRSDACKLLVVSESVDVCRKIGCQWLLKVESLLDSEAWELFEEKLGNRVLTPAIKGVAQDIVKNCGGSPSGIIIMAANMRALTDIHEWKDALASIDGFMRKILSPYLFAYNQLEKLKDQHCIQYCALYPKEEELSEYELIDMLIVEGLMDERLSREFEFHQGHAVLNRLERAHLLVRLDIGGNKYVKMPSLSRETALHITGRSPMPSCSRETALRITKNNPRFMVKAGLGLKEIPPERDWEEDLNKVSLMRNMITDIPEGASPNCPSISTLNLSRNPLSVIPESFFWHMRSLKNLDLSHTDIEQLPNSVSALENLRGLRLGNCKRLKYLPSLENLKELTQLDLSCTNIKKVIHGMENLVNLKNLNLFDACMEMIQSGVLQKFSHLQRLILPIDMVLAVEEVEGLKHLEEFQGTFRDMEDLNRFIESQHCDWQLSCFEVGNGHMHLKKILKQD